MLVVHTTLGGFQTRLKKPIIGTRKKFHAAEENMALARRFLEARIKGNLDAVYEMMSPDFVSHTKLLPDQEPTRESHIWTTAH